MDEVQFHQSIDQRRRLGPGHGRFPPCLDLLESSAHQADCAAILLSIEVLTTVRWELPQPCRRRLAFYKPVYNI